MRTNRLPLLLIAAAGLLAACTKPAGDAAKPAACTTCHTDTTTSAVNPTSGLHNVIPTVSGQQQRAIAALARRRLINPYAAGTTNSDSSGAVTMPPSMGAARRNCAPRSARTG